ncbi:MAG: cyanophycinase, partial [Thermomicrobiaceae bacterium]|nr:cyanophycinase [Thermomicrobiaceae bacterium]
MAGRVAARRGRSTLALLVAVALLGLVASPPRAGAQIDQVLHPIGGGYSDATVGHFVQTVIDHATGERVRILIIPSAYDHTSLGYAKQHVDRFEAVCASLLGATPRFAQGCEAALVPLWSRPDAENRANVASIADPETDGVFFLGGDQGAAMEIIAGTAAERAMEAGYRRGVVVGGTSAGTAVESRTMIADYANGGGPATGLERGKVLIWWGDDADLERGLSFGSRRVVFDQHFYQLGRLGRSLNAVAESVERLGDGGLLGVGVDYATSADLTDDGLLSEVAGSSSVMVIDFAQATHRWVGPLQTLSARGVLTQVLPAGPYGYDVARRAPLVAGAPVSTVDPGPWPADLFPTGPGAVILGGDLLDGGDGLRQFVDRARATGRSRIVLVVAGYPSTGDAESEARAYVQA